MSDGSIIQIPTVWSRRPRADRDLPISERENLMLALNHQKPMWMPNLYAATQAAPMNCIGELPETMFADSNDWFGIKFIFTEAVGSNTPIEGLFAEIGEWEEKTPWPNLDVWNFNNGKDDFVRDENLALFLNWGNGLFERMHTLLGFEQALVDLLLEPDECIRFLNCLADFKIDVFRRIREEYEFDYVTYYDDWGTEQGTFFSKELMKTNFLKPMRRIVEYVQESNVKFFFHSCGRVDDFIPYYVNDIGADALEIQRINDILHIVKTYGEHTTVEYRPDPVFMYDPDTTEAQARICARELVDMYGAHVNPGAGVVLSPIALRDEVYYAFDEEVFSYSLEKYAK